MPSHHSELTHSSSMPDESAPFGSCHTPAITPLCTRPSLSGDREFRHKLTMSQTGRIRLFGVTFMPNAAKWIGLNRLNGAGAMGIESSERHSGCWYQSRWLIIGDEITVEVKPLQPLLDRANCVNIQSNCTKQNVALFLNGMPLRGIPPVADIHNETLRYPLQRTDDTKDVWSALLGAPKATVRTVSVSVGLENEYPVATQVTKFPLIVLRAGWSLVALGIVLLMVVGIFILAARSALLRDPGPAEAASDDTIPWGRKVKRKVMVPYSLGRVQMAFWFLLVVASFLFIWVTTGQHDTLSTQVLALIGIGTGTALGSALIDANKKEQSQSAVTSLEAEKITLQEEIEEMAPGNKELETEMVAKQQRQRTLESDLQKARKALTPLKSEGFFRDILRDANGITFHRFQLLVWTVVLGLIFCVSVYRSLAMPQFSDTLLALMEITSGTYIGFKFPEQHTK